MYMQQPHTIVIFGGTGDLAREKLFPALEGLWKKGQLSATSIIGFGRRQWDFEDFHAHLFGYHAYDPEFLKLVCYHQGNFDDVRSFDELASKLKGPVLFYLSIGPDKYETVIETFSRSKAALSFENPQTRLLIEKPFGLSLEGAVRLEEKILGMCGEDQVMRVDHYLAKEEVVRMAALRRAGEPLEAGEKRAKKGSGPVSVALRIFEKKDIGTRGESYDHVGALVDVGQNHLLQVLATFLLEAHVSRAEALSSLVMLNCARGQYEGYAAHKGVAPGSETETYFRLELESMLPRWAGVRFVLEAGKTLGLSAADITLTYEDGTQHVINVQEKANAYEKVFAAAFAGDHAPFPTMQEIRASWIIAEHARSIMRQKPLATYPKGWLAR